MIATRGGVERSQIIGAALGSFIFASAVLLYIAFRPPSLYLFTWIDALGLSGTVETIRSFAALWRPSFPFVAVYSLPFALGLMGYLLWIGALWEGSRKHVRYSWYAVGVATAMGSELIQLMSWVPGRFDPMDLIAYGFAAFGGGLTIGLISLLNTRNRYDYF